MNSNLDKAREIFLTDVDDETRTENLEKIREWEQSLRDNEAMADWKEHPITKSIIEQARKAHIDACLSLTDRMRDSIELRARYFALKDATLWLISLAASDPKAEIERLNNEIRQAINATNY